MQDAEYKLISFSFCPYVQRPRLVMLEKDIEHTVEYIDLRQPPPWFHEVSPLEKVPVLMVGEQALFESMPISEYLDEITPGSLYPEDPLHRAQHRAWIEFANDMLGQHHTMVMAKDEAGLKRARGQLLERLDTLEEVLTAQGPFFAGPEFGMVDVVYAPLFRFMDLVQEQTGLELITGETPKIRKWSSTLLARRTVQEAVPASFRDDYLAFLHRQHGQISRLLAS